MANRKALAVLLASAMSFGFLAATCNGDHKLLNESYNQSLPLDSALFGTWRQEIFCNFAWGNGCQEVDHSQPDYYVSFDSKGGYRSMLEGEKAYQTTYRIVLKEDFRFNRIARMIELPGGEYFTYRFAGPDSLWLAMVAFDGPAFCYVRVTDSL